MQEKNSLDSWTFWQKQPHGAAHPEPSILIEAFHDVISIRAEGKHVTLNYESVDEFCKLLKFIKRNVDWKGKTRKGKKTIYKDDGKDNAV